NIRNGLLACHGEKISAFCRDFFAFDSVTPCYQVVYRPAAPLPLKGSLRFEKASERYLPKIVETYDRETPEALEKLVRQGKIYCAFAAAQGEGAEEETFVGYIGQHPEGSMGLLYIFPEFRRRGYAQELESFQINAVLAEGRTPYAHIIEDNFKSFALQQKLGAIVADDKVVWMSRSSRKRE
ncbi:MAG: GNAT family N-acetyltransferase, partial [Candidatus Scatosoma sp.]